MALVIQRIKKIECATISEGGALRGICTMWNQTIMELNVVDKNHYWVKTNFKNKNTGKSITIFNICAPVRYKDKEICWQSLANQLASEDNQSIIVGGDFDLVMNIGDKKGGSFLPYQSINKLEIIIEEHNLMDVIPKNNKLTWSNRRMVPINIKERLERILIHANFISGT